MDNGKKLEEKSSTRCCGTCYWYNGEIGDGNQFCEENEAYVDENF